MSKEINRFLQSIRLSCIASFLAGAYSLLLINFFWFERSITPPGVSALVACMALAFSVYAASKVLKWYEDKKNNRAFLQTEKIVEEISRCYTIFSQTYTKLNTYNALHETMKKEKCYEREDFILEKIDLLLEIDDNIHVLTITSKIWGVTLQKNILIEVEKISEFIMTLKMDFLILITSKEQKKEQIESLINRMASNLSRFECIFKLKYQEWFILEDEKNKMS